MDIKILIKQEKQEAFNVPVSTSVTPQMNKQLEYAMTETGQSKKYILQRILEIALQDAAFTFTEDSE